jgi:hypothetical protein
LVQDRPFFTPLWRYPVKMSRILLALGVAAAIAAPTAASAAMLDDMMARMKDAPHADAIAAAMAGADTGDRDFWLKCTFHKTDACDAALAELMAK